MTLKELIETHGEAVVERWALKEYRQWLRREAKPKKPKPPSVKALNAWLKTASETEVEELKNRSVALR